MAASDPYRVPGAVDGDPPRATTGHGVLVRLRSATGGLHASLEGAVDAVARLRSPAERPELIARYRAMYDGAARLLAPWFTGAGPSPAGGTVIGSRSEALGFRYVIEGSALGGRIILRELASLGVDTAGLGFLDPHGAGTGEWWRGFCRLLERELAFPPGDLDEAVAGAVKGFAFVRSCLLDGGPRA